MTNATIMVKNLISFMEYHQDKIRLDFTSNFGFGQVLFQDTTIAIIYSKCSQEMSKSFWNTAPGSNIIIRVNSSVLGFDYDEENVFIGFDNLDNPGEQLQEVIEKVFSAWKKLNNECQDILGDSDLFISPFTFEIKNGNIYLANIIIGHHWLASESLTGSETVRLFNDKDEMIFIEPGMKSVLNNLDKIFTV
tara:strand:+ start:1239 stop:1814 length:576 start_codon:yes stop_codon:yes gene_type:complete